MSLEDRLKRCEKASDELHRRVWTPDYTEMVCPACERRIDGIIFRLRKSREIYECPKCEQVIAKNHREARVMLQCNGKTTWREDIIFLVLGILPEDWAWSVIGVMGMCYERIQEAYYGWLERWENLRGWYDPPTWLADGTRIGLLPGVTFGIMLAISIKIINDVNSCVDCTMQPMQPYQPVLVLVVILTGTITYSLLWFSGGKK